MPRHPAPRLVVPDAIDPAVFRSFDPEANVVQLAGETMGTSWQVRAALPAARAGDAARLRSLIEARLGGIVAQMSHWDDSSTLSRFNQAQGGSAIRLPPDLAAVIDAGLAIARASDGAFDPAIGRSTDAWGLGPRAVTTPPDAADLLVGKAASGWQRLAYDAGAQTLRQPGGLWLDLSGIAKGYAVDAVADLLDDEGVHHSLVEIGGECAGRGLRPDGDPWWVDIESPPGCALPRLRIALHQLAVATSGDYLRGAHTLDPRTGQPAIHATTAVTVLHPRCMQADAWATALSVVDLPQAMDMARRNALIARIVLRDGGEWISPALAAMMEAQDVAAA